MDTESRPQNPGVHRNPLLILGGILGIALVHFAIANGLERADPPGFQYTIIRTILVLPGFLATLLLEGWHGSGYSDAFLDYFPIAFSSLFYGMLGGFVISGKLYLRAVGIAILLMIVILGCFFGFIFAWISIMLSD